MNVADALNPRTFENEECVIRQGDAADGMYFVEAGTVRITVAGENDIEVEVSRVTKGGYLGELALVTHRPRAASAYCVGPVRLACKLFLLPLSLSFSLQTKSIQLGFNNRFFFFSGLVFLPLTVLDVQAFERLMGPCMNIMKRNIDDYEDQLIRIFGSRVNMSDIR